MKTFTQHTGVAVPMCIDNVDTDQIIPSREMKRVSREGLGEGLFAGWRYSYKGGEKTGLRSDFVLNLPEYAGASIILGGKNWGCGSSREHAAWALYDYGIRVIIAESFGRIFLGNCARNGLLAIELPRGCIDAIVNLSRKSSQANQILVDLEECEIRTPQGDVFNFSAAQADRHMLLNGLDHIDFSLQFDDDIKSFEKNDQAARPWAYLT